MIRINVAYPIVPMLPEETSSITEQWIELILPETRSKKGLHMRDEF